MTEANTLDALVAEIWGRHALEGAPDVTPEVRERQNEVLSIAIRTYLQSYLDDMPSVP